MWLKNLFIAITLATLVACSSVTTLDESFYLDSNTPWHSVITTPGRLDLILEPKHGSTVILKTEKSKRREAFEIKISDRDCETGFEISLRETSDEGAIRNQYFNAPIPWGEPIALSIEIHADRSFTVYAAGQSLSGKTNYKPRQLTLTALRGSAQIQQLRYRSTHRE